MQLRLEHCHEELTIATKADNKTVTRFLRQLDIFTSDNEGLTRDGFFTTTLSWAEVMKFVLYVILEIRRGCVCPMSQPRLGYWLTVHFGVQRNSGYCYACESLSNLATVGGLPRSLLDIEPEGKSYIRGAGVVMQRGYVEYPLQQGVTNIEHPSMGRSVFMPNKVPSMGRSVFMPDEVAQDDVWTMKSVGTMTRVFVNEKADMSNDMFEYDEMYGEKNTLCISSKGKPTFNLIVFLHLICKGAEENGVALKDKLFWRGDSDLGGLTAGLSFEWSKNLPPAERCLLQSMTFLGPPPKPTQNLL